MPNALVNAMRQQDEFVRGHRFRNAIAKGDQKTAMRMNPQMATAIQREQRLQGQFQNTQQQQQMKAQQQQKKQAALELLAVGRSVEAAKTDEEKELLIRHYQPMLEQRFGLKGEEMDPEDWVKEFNKYEPMLMASVYGDLPVEAQRKVLNIRKEKKKPTLQRVSAIVEGEDRPSTLIFNPREGTFERTLSGGRRETIPSERVTQVSVTGGQEDVVPVSKNRADDIRATRDWLQFQVGDIDRMLNLVEEDPSLVGAPGAFRRIGQTVTGAAEDLSSMFQGEAARTAEGMITQAKATARGDLPEEQYEKMFNDPALSELRLFENTLAYTLARLRKPEGRLPVAVIEDAKKDAKLTGFTSSRDVQNRLKAIRGQIKHRLGSMEQRLGNEPQQNGQRERQPRVDWVIGEDGVPRRQ